MASIYCSIKLATLVGKENLLLPDPDAKVDPMSAWSAHLFSLAGKKCIIFVNKATFFTFFRLGVLKKDLADLPAFFQEGLSRQMAADKLQWLPVLAEWQKPSEAHTFYTSDNDRVVMGMINTILGNTKYAYARKPSPFTEWEVKYGSVTNRYPMGPLKNRIPIDEIMRREQLLSPENTMSEGPTASNPKTERPPQIGESISEIVRFPAEKLLKEYYGDRVSDAFRDEVRNEIEFHGDSFILCESLLEDFADPNSWEKRAVARFRYDRHTASWLLYYWDDNGKWRLDPENKPHLSLEDLVEIVEDDVEDLYWVG